MAIKIRKRVEEEKRPEALEPEVLQPGGEPAADVSNVAVPGMDDKFLETSGSMMSWLMEHRRMVILVACVVVVAAFSWLGIRHGMEVNATSLSQNLSDAFVTYSAITKAEAQEIETAREQYLKSQGIAADTTDILRFTYSVPDDRARFAMIEKYLSATLPNLEGKEVGISGELMLAGAMARLSHRDGAAAAYEAARASRAPDVVMFADLGSIEMLLDAQKYDEAIARLDALMDRHPGMSAYATLQKGSIYELTGARDKAIAAYDKVIREFGQERDKAIATSRLRYLTADWREHLQAAVPAQPQVAL